MKYQIIFYETSSQNPVKDFILSLDEKTQIKFGALLKRLENNPMRLKEFSKKLTKNIYELRLYYNQKWHRILYTFEKNKIILLLHGFIKKTNKIPLKEIKTAEQRFKIYRKMEGE